MNAFSKIKLTSFVALVNVRPYSVWFILESEFLRQLNVTPIVKRNICLPRKLRFIDIYKYVLYSDL